MDSNYYFIPSMSGETISSSPLHNNNNNINNSKNINIKRRGNNHNNYNTMATLSISPTSALDLSQVKLSNNDDCSDQVPYYDSVDENSNNVNLIDKFNNNQQINNNEKNNNNNQIEQEEEEEEKEQQDPMDLDQEIPQDDENLESQNEIVVPITENKNNNNNNIDNNVTKIDSSSNNSGTTEDSELVVEEEEEEDEEEEDDDDDEEDEDENNNNNTYTSSSSSNYNTYKSNERVLIYADNLVRNELLNVMEYLKKVEKNGDKQPEEVIVHEIYL